MAKKYLTIQIKVENEEEAKDLLKYLDKWLGSYSYKLMDKTL